MKIAILSNITIDLLASLIKKKNDVYISTGFDTWQQDILMTTSDLYQYRPDVVIILVHAGGFEWKDKQAGCRRLDEWCDTVKVLRERLKDIPIFVSSLDIKEHCQFGSEIRLGEHFESYFIESIQSVYSKLGNVFILPVKEIIVNIGRDRFYSDKMWYVGAMPYSMEGLEVLNSLISRYVVAVSGKKKKCIVVDLDNTLWGGVIGEEGVGGIELSNLGIGARYYDTQRILKKIKEQGVMLAIISKNNVEDVEPVFEHPNMLLQPEDFVEILINWDEKSKNMLHLAKILNIGLDAFVFLDDNPVEREKMTMECPEVEVMDFPIDSSKLPQVVENAYYENFFSLEVTGEDRAKTDMYKAESQRKAEYSRTPSVEDFLKKLEMTMTVHRMLKEEEIRVVQLLSKTNQFNLTTKRYSTQDIKELQKHGDVITVHMADKYGNQGLVSVVILVYKDLTAEIDVFLMSCRVMGRNAEIEIMAMIKEFLKGKGIQEIYATYYPTRKNSPVENFYEQIGFSVLEKKESEKRYKTFVENLPDTTEIFKEVKVNWI